MLFRAQVVIFAHIMLASSAPLCSNDRERALHNEYVQCQAVAQTKLRNATLSICDYLEETVHNCANKLQPCRGEEELRLLIFP